MSVNGTCPFVTYTVQFAPCAHNIDVVERDLYPAFMQLGEVESCLATQCLQACRIASTDAPHIFYWAPFQCLLTLIVRIYHAAVAVCLELLSQFGGYLCQRLGRCQSDADGHAYLTLHTLMQVLAPRL